MTIMSLVVAALALTASAAAFSGVGVAAYSRSAYSGVGAATHVSKPRRVAVHVPCGHGMHVGCPASGW